MTSEETKSKMRSRSRSTVKDPSRVFSFGCLEPSAEVAGKIRTQTEEAKKYQTMLVNNEITRRSERDSEVMRSHPPYAAARELVKEIEERISQDYELLSKERARTRKRLSMDEVTSRITSNKQLRREAWKQAATAKREFMKGMTPAFEELKRRYSASVEEHGASTNPKLKARLREEVLAAMEKEPWPEAWKRLMAIDARALRADKDARASTKGKLWVGTRELFREGFADSSRKTAAEGGRMSLPVGIDGRIGILLLIGKEPIVADDGTVQHRLFSLVPRIRAKDGRDRGGKRFRLKRAMEARIRMGAGEDSEVRINCIAHRPLPPGGKVKRVWILVTREGPRTRYQLQITIQAPGLDERVAAVRKAAVAVKLGFAAELCSADRTPALIVGTWLGSDGARGTIVVDSRTNESMLHVDTLQMHSRAHFNEALRVLRLWMRWTTESPEWLAKKMDGSHQWRSARNLAPVAFDFRGELESRGIDVTELWREWRQTCDRNRADYHQSLSRVRAWMRHRGYRDQVVHLAVFMEWWRRKNRHLHTWEVNSRATAQRRRLEGFRIESKKLAARYQDLVIVSANFRKMAELSNPEDKVEGDETRKNGQRRRASPGILAVVLANAFRTKADQVRISPCSLEDAIKDYAETDRIPLAR
jgi:hypothetical protein